MYSFVKQWDQNQLIAANAKERGQNYMNDICHLCSRVRSFARNSEESNGNVQARKWRIKGSQFYCTFFAIIFKKCTVFEKTPFASRFDAERKANASFRCIVFSNSELLMQCSEQQWTTDAMFGATVNYWCHGLCDADWQCADFSTARRWRTMRGLLNCRARNVWRLSVSGCRNCAIIDS